MTIADLFVDVKFAPDKNSLKKATDAAKDEFQQMSNKISGIANGIKGLFAIKAISLVTNGVRTIASYTLNAAQNAAMLDKMARRAGKSVEQFQKDRGDATILSREEVDRLKSLNSIFGEVQRTISKIASGVLMQFMPIIARISEAIKQFTDSGAIMNIIKIIIKAINWVIEALEPILGFVQNIFKAVKAYVPALRKTFDPLFNSIKNIIRMVLNGINAISGSGMKTINNLVKAANLFLYPVKVLIALIEEIFAIFDDDVDGFYEQQTSFKPLVEKIKAAKEWLLSFFEKIADWIGIVQDKMYEWISGFYKWTSDAVSEAIVFWGDFFSRMGKWISNTYSDTTTRLAYILKNVKDGIMSIWETAKAAMDWIFGKLEAIKNAILGVVDKAKSLVDFLNPFGSSKSVKSSVDAASSMMRGQAPQATYSPLQPIGNTSTSTDNRKISNVSSSPTTNNNTNITVNVSGGGDKAEITRAVEMGINKSRLQNAALVR